LNYKFELPGQLPLHVIVFLLEVPTGNVFNPWLRRLCVYTFFKLGDHMGKTDRWTSVLRPAGSKAESKSVWQEMEWALLVASRYTSSRNCKKLNDTRFGRISELVIVSEQTTDKWGLFGTDLLWYWPTAVFPGSWLFHL